MVMVGAERVMVMVMVWAERVMVMVMVGVEGAGWYRYNRLGVIFETQLKRVFVWKETGREVRWARRFFKKRPYVFHWVNHLNI